MSLLLQYMDFAPPGVSVGKVKELAMKFKGEQLEAEIQKLWDGEWHTVRYFYMSRVSPAPSVIQ